MEKTDKIAKMKMAKAIKNVDTTPKKTVRRRDARNANLVQLTAELTGKTENYVRKVMNWERRNEEVALVFMELSEGSNKLKEAVKTLLPFEDYKNIELEVKYKICN